MLKAQTEGRFVNFGVGLKFIMLPKGQAYSHRIVCPSVRLKPILHSPRTEFDKTSYMNSLGYCTDVSFLVFQFDALSWKKRA